MIPLKQIKPKSAVTKMKQNKVDIGPTDPQNSYFKNEMFQILF